MSGRVDSHGCCKFDNAALGFGPRDQSAHFPVFLHLRTTNLPGPSCAANMHNEEEWNAGITNMTVREEDVHDRDPDRQGHVSASPFTPSAVARVSFAGQLCLPTALTHGRFASCLCLCLCVTPKRHLRTTICLAPTASCAVSKHNKEGLSADITNTSVCGNDVLDCDVAHQCHASAHLYPSWTITCESLGASCFAPH